MRVWGFEAQRLFVARLYIYSYLLRVDLLANYPRILKKLVGGFYSPLSCLRYFAGVQPNSFLKLRTKCEGVAKPHS